MPSVFVYCFTGGGIRLRTHSHAEKRTRETHIHTHTVHFDKIHSPTEYLVILNQTILFICARFVLRVARDCDRTEKKKEKKNSSVNFKFFIVRFADFSHNYLLTTPFIFCGGSRSNIQYSIVSIVVLFLYRYILFESRSIDFRLFIFASISLCRRGFAQLFEKRLIWDIHIIRFCLIAIASVLFVCFATRFEKV